MLSSEFDILEAENGMEASAILHNQEHEISLMLLDIVMPVMDGLTATKTIRSMARQDAGIIPILAMTANAFAEDVKDAMDAGMDAHIAKPVDMELLRRVFKLYLR